MAWWTHMRDGVPVRETQMGTSWGSTRPSAKCCTWDCAIPVWCELQRHMRSSGSQQYPGWHHQQAEGNNPPPLHCSARHPPGVLYSFLESQYKKSINLMEWIWRRPPKNYQRDGISILWWTIQKKSFTMGVLKHWNRLPREVVVYLETFKIRLDGALSNFI